MFSHDYHDANMQFKRLWWPCFVRITTFFRLICPPKFNLTQRNNPFPEFVLTVHNSSIQYGLFGGFGGVKKSFSWSCSSCVFFFAFWGFFSIEFHLKFHCCKVVLWPQGREGGKERGDFSLCSWPLQPFLTPSSSNSKLGVADSNGKGEKQANGK